MPEALSRTLLGLELAVFALPGSLFVVPLALPGVLFLTPVALFGLVQALLAGGPEMGEQLRVFGGMLLTAALGLCAVAAVAALLGLGAVFLLRGREGLRGQAAMTRIALLAAAPPLLLASLPRVWAEVSAGTGGFDALAATLCYAGLPLLVPAAHLLLEFRAGRRA